MGVVGGKASQELRGPLEAERKRSAFGPTTERTAALFQQKLGEDHELTISGEVDEATARALNVLGSADPRRAPTWT